MVRAKSMFFYIVNNLWWRFFSQQNKDQIARNTILLIYLECVYANHNVERQVRYTVPDVNAI